MANDLSENSENQALKPLVFDNNAKKFLSNKLVKEICSIDAAFKEAESFMLDPSISGKEMADYLSKEGNIQKLREAFDRFKPVINCQIRDLIRDKSYAGLDTKSLLKKFKNKLNDCFKSVNFANRPLLKMIVDELIFLIEISIVDSKQGIDAANNIELAREFAKELTADKNLSGLYTLKYAVYATKLHNTIISQVIPPTDEGVTLSLKDTDITISISKNANIKAFEFATVKVTNGEKSFITTISLLNSQLNCEGSKLVSLKDIFTTVKAESHYEYLRFKIFEAIENALLEDKFEKRKVEEVTEQVKIEVKEVVEPILPKPEKPKKKQMEGAKQFANIRTDAATNALLRFRGVIEVQHWDHSGSRTFTKIVDGVSKKVNLMPFRDKYTANPHSIKSILDAFGINYEDFKDKL